MLKTLSETKLVTVMINDTKRIVPEGISVAAALLLHQQTPYREHIVSSKPRAPYCMMGICYDCLVTINGVENLQGCMVFVENAMEITTQKANEIASISEE